MTTEAVSWAPIGSARYSRQIHSHHLERCAWGQEPRGQRLRFRRANCFQQLERLRAARTQTTAKVQRSATSRAARTETERRSGWPGRGREVLRAAEALVRSGGPSRSRSEEWSRGAPPAGPVWRGTGCRLLGVLWGNIAEAQGLAAELGPRWGVRSPSLPLLPRGGFNSGKFCRRAAAPAGAGTRALQLPADPSSRKTDHVTTLAPTSRFQVSACN